MIGNPYNVRGSVNRYLEEQFFSMCYTPLVTIVWPFDPQVVISRNCFGRFLRQYHIHILLYGTILILKKCFFCFEKKNNFRSFVVPRLLLLVTKIILFYLLVTVWELSRSKYQVLSVQRYTGSTVACIIGSMPDQRWWIVARASFIGGYPIKYYKYSSKHCCSDVVTAFPTLDQHCLDIVFAGWVLRTRCVHNGWCSSIYYWYGFVYMVNTRTC